MAVLFDHLSGDGAGHILPHAVLKARALLWCLDRSGYGWCGLYRCGGGGAPCEQQTKDQDSGSHSGSVALEGSLRAGLGTTSMGPSGLFILGSNRSGSSSVSCSERSVGPSQWEGG